MSTSTSAIESRCRRAAARHGERVVKVPERSRSYHQYGPYMVVDVQTNGVVDHSQDLDGIAARYGKR